MKKRNLVRRIKQAMTDLARSRLWLVAAGLAAVRLAAGWHDARAVTIDLTPEKRAPDGYYNMRLGNIRASFTASVTGTWSDNVNRSDDDGGKNSSGKVSGFSISPSLGMSLYWPVSPYLTISSGGTAGLVYYPDDSGENDWYLTGDNAGSFATSVAAELKLGQNGTLTIQDAISRDIDTLAMDAWLTNDDDEVDDWAQIRNVFSILYAVDLNDVTNLKLHYDHTTTWTSPRAYQYMDYDSDTIDLVLLRDINRSLQLGPYGTVTSTRYRHGDPGNDNTPRNDTMNYSGGLAMTYRRSAGFVLDGRFGYQVHVADSDNFNADNKTGQTFTYSLNANFASSEYLLHTFSSSYSIQEDYLYSSVTRAYTWENMYAVSYQLNEDWMLNADAAWINTQEDDNGGNNSDLLRFGLGTSRELGKQTSISFRYEFTTRMGDDDPQDYTRNTVSVTLSHRF